ncbi:MAG: MtaA/CmuA family methyltransferase [Clostridium argentinense]|uniref:MtaA/CmuA family methyltransferase n=1 Tax=Clostridium faecium TaxID=2762223 RepID=A0ABR8YTI0_9CLOT|nr:MULTISPECIES: methylcobamide:CoM methyltransferase MtbA [Clostridium]MBD8047303.1 MtaA/CmuA family methyltransferase [Clostridium faecium]MBS5825108.1 MtaA/CmuA family methyltransferase [Clostridium argentinense]MDU1350765.1 MtaA/CmuA family methyltransferase [Clostridium argentinense]
MLTSKERLFKVLKNEEVDRPPCICPGGMMNMIIEDLMDITGIKWPDAHTNSKLMADLAYSMYENGGFENCGVPFCMTVEAESMGAGVSLGDKTTEPRVTDYVINSVADYEKLKNIDSNSGRAKVVIDAIKILSERNLDVPIVANITGPISLASSIMDPIVFYKELVRKKEKSHKYMEVITENLISFGKAQLEAGAEILAISDPSGTGEILGPRLFNEFAIPYINKIVEALKPYTKGGVIVHICGKLKSVYENLQNLKCDAISFDSITSVKEVKQNVKGKAIMGNVSTLTLFNGGCDLIKNISSHCIKNGVDILSPACGIGITTPLKNIKTMVEVAKES